MMTHWVQYHTPERMGCGIDFDEGPPFSVVTDKADVSNPVGDVVWLVGITEEPNSPVYLGQWFVVDGVETPPDDFDFLFMYVGQVGRSCRPMPIISDQPWYRRLLGMTGNYKFGFTKVKYPDVLAGLRATAARAGCAQE